jgi:hypothetical protein
MPDVRFFLRFWLEVGPTSGSFWRGEIEEVGRKERHGVKDAATIVRLIRRRLERASGVPLPLGHPDQSER